MGFCNVFYQDDISGYDLILQCPFMLNNSMGPLLHRRCLVVESEDNLFYSLRICPGDVSASRSVSQLLLLDILSD